MIFSNYNNSEIALKKSVANLERLINRKEELFTGTQPSSPSTDSVRSTANHSAVDNYLIRVEEEGLDTKIRIASEIVRYRESVLVFWKNRLIESRDIKDVIYYQRHIKNRSYGEIEASIGYSRSQLFRYVKEIEAEIKKEM